MIPSTTHQQNPADQTTARPLREFGWIAGWLAYSLLALGFFAWQDSWLGFMCITR
jgi:hypothetical protein